MTIKERREREEYDRKNPWRPASLAQPGEAVCELRNSQLIEFGTARFFLHEDGDWYAVNAYQLKSRFDVMEFRPTGETVGKERRDRIVAEYRSGARWVE